MNNTNTMEIIRDGQAGIIKTPSSSSQDNDRNIIPGIVIFVGALIFFWLIKAYIQYRRNKICGGKNGNKKGGKNNKGKRNRRHAKAKSSTGKTGVIFTIAPPSDSEFDSESESEYEEEEPTPAVSSPAPLVKNIEVRKATFMEMLTSV